VSTIFTLRPQARRDTIVVYHDYLCPWCYIGFFQIKKLVEVFGVELDWVGAELFPPEMEGPPSKPGPLPISPPDPSKPLTRFAQFCETEGIALPSPRPGFVRTHHALLGAEWAKANHQFEAYNEAVYRAYWERCENIESIDCLISIANSVSLDGEAMASSIRAEQYAERIVAFDDDAYNIGVRHVPTFVFGAEEQLAEAHYVELAFATERFLLRKSK
jgi:predicted DsbA family dithiol-disulfide isomerase